MAGIFDHLHLKRNTAGSSNELSFDVLDAARTGLDGKEKRRDRMPKAPKAYKGSYHGVKGTATFSDEVEVAKRKKARRTNAIRTWVVVASLVVIGLCILAWLGYKNYLELQDYSTRFASIVGQFKEKDDLLVEVDALMGTLEEPADQPARASALEKMQDKGKDFDRMRESVGSTRRLAMDDGDLRALEDVEAGIAAREEMFGAASEAFTLTAAIDKTGKQASSIWNKVVDADQVAKEATRDANAATTEELTTKAQEKTKSALDELNSAAESLQALDVSDDTVDFSPQLAYMKKKASALEAALQTAKALLEEDREKASESNEAYNKADREAAKLAKELPLSPEEAVWKAYEPKLAPISKRYDEAREAAVDADAAIAAYLKA